ncbi:inactive ubiquitin carboxyl-terminal hydrolase MINDY-4B isoform X2 [Xyrauchen texanus]|uniref:inactive ubiquitin carboxyl-terminal hydrolase MINDY-4B isoform X2 n=1 Tax=Xyrauchen texanus TaxID=154827 RepID=UPI002241FBB8|nr:inactive ubiquitin carboxyl-terminal hydrolase MINDY-4B isoform X2 [Xyrauchen texanus]
MDDGVDNTISELDDILQQIADLDKWREIFNSRGLELQDCIVKRPIEKIKADEDNEDSSRPATATQHISVQSNLFTVPYSVPHTLAVSPSLGGQPLSPEIAVNLRKILFGNTFHVFNYEWKKSFFKFREPFSDMSYALEAERGGARAIQMVVQAHIIKYLLFSRPMNPECTTQSSFFLSLVDVGENEQRKALADALTDILWTAGEEQTATVSLVTSERCFTPHLDYKMDSFTERFKEEGSHGIILFLYSLIFSRSIDRIRADFDFSTTYLLNLTLGNFVCRQALLNLLLTGRASPNIFNGTLLNDKLSKPLVHPLHGVLTRSDVGYMLWNREQFDHANLPQVGSMLKTPKLPIWVCNINGTYSVLFSPNRSLLSDWKMEHLFYLYFYNGQPTQSTTTMLTIDTHSHHWEAGNNDIQGDPEKRFPSVEMTIRTKWEGAVIDWNGTVPFF